MFLTRLAGALTTVGTACSFAVFFLGGDAVAPLSPDTVIAPALAGIAGAYLLLGAVATAEFRTGAELSTGGTFAATFAALALAALLNVLHPLFRSGMDGGAVGMETVGLAVGAAALTYPIAAAFAVGTAPRPARAAVTTAVAVAGTGLVLVLALGSDGTLGAAAAGIAATLVVDLVAGYPLYRLGRALAEHRASPFADRSVPPGVEQAGGEF